jgi:hypothetical protein
MQETDLYPPVKAFFEAEGYEVKAEVTGCDVVAQKDDAPMVIVELKTAFNIDLVLQGVERQKLCDDVYLAVPKPDTPTKRKNWRRRQRALKHLCQRLGVGLMLVDVVADVARAVDVVLDPAPYQPRKSTKKQSKLRKEFQARTGDPNTGGSTRTKIMTAYRQDAIRLADALAGEKALKVSEIKEITGVDRAASILQNNHYGWFERASRGVYRLTELGQSAVDSLSSRT